MISASLALIIRNEMPLRATRQRMDGAILIGGGWIDSTGE
jgi:hypothetical protein